MHLQSGSDAAIVDTLNLFELSIERFEVESLKRRYDHWFECLENILLNAAKLQNLEVNGQCIVELQRISERGSPAWRLDGQFGPIAKLRVDPQPEVARRIVGFLNYSEERKWLNGARLIAYFGRAVLKTWVPGLPIKEFDLGNRVDLIHKVARSLSELHGNEIEPFLICGADHYNTVIREDGEVSFVDLEACLRGSRWLDLMWSEEFLCRTSQEREMLWQIYLNAAGLPSPNREERRQARISLLEWLRTQLGAGVERYPNDVEIRIDFEKVVAALREVR